MRGDGWRPPRNVIEAAEQKYSSLKGIAGLYAEKARRLIEQRLEEARDKIRLLPYRGPDPGSTPHAAEDGGSGLIDFETFSVYGVQAWAGAFQGSGPAYKLASEVRAADAGIILPAGSEDLRVRFYRETLEAWAARQAILGLPEGSWLLWDGSVTTLLTGRRPWSESELRIQTLLSKAAEALGVRDEELIDIVSGWHREKPLSVVENLYDTGGDSIIMGENSHIWVSFLEWLEKLESVALLFETVFERNARIVFITKTTRSKSLLGGPFPDVLYLRSAQPREPFHTVPKLRRGVFPTSPSSRVPARFFPGKYGETFQENLYVLSLYVRLDPGTPILHVEEVIPAGEVDPLDPEYAENRAGEIVGFLQGLTRRQGYPYSLLVAHREARLSPYDLERAALVLGVKGERPGRGMLE